MKLQARATPALAENRDREARTKLAKRHIPVTSDMMIAIAKDNVVFAKLYTYELPGGRGIVAPPSVIEMTVILVRLNPSLPTTTNVLPAVTRLNLLHHLMPSLHCANPNNEPIDGGTSCDTVIPASIPCDQVL